MLNETKQIATCAEKLKYSEGFFYERASQKRGFDIQTQQNHYGKKLHSLFKLAFKSITASRDDEKFMSEVFVYPKSACRIATKRLEETLRELSGRDPIGTFRELRNDHIMQFAERIISDALLTRPTKRQAGIDRMYLLLGERGCGKTTLINYIFLKNRIEFDEKKIIWIRNSVFFKNKPRSKKEIEDNFYSHLLEVIEEHYNGRLKLNEIETQIEIWRDKVALLSEEIRLDPNSPQLKNIINESINQDRNEYAKKIIKYAKNCGYAFIFIIDNIDQYDTCEEIVKELIDFAVKLTSKPTKSLVILVSRIDTVNDCMNYFRDVFQNIDENIYSIPSPNFRDVFERRLFYIQKHVDDESELKEIVIDGIPWKISTGYIARNLAKYFLTITTDADDQEQYIISELANHNIRDMFRMIKSILTTHISDVTDNPISKIKEFTRNGIDKDVDFEDDTIRRHLIVWALMLKNNHLYYKDEETRTWISNIYNTRNQKDSYFLKRLMIDFFAYMLKKRENEIIFKDQINYVFCEEMLFERSEVNECINLLSDRRKNGQLIFFEKSREGYRLTPKGFFFVDYIVNLFSYYELIIEDTLIPTQEGNEYSVEVSLVQFEPLVFPDKKRRKDAHVKYFNIKSKQLAKFLIFLECRELLEKEKHNNFKSKSTGFKAEYFPKLSSILEEQRKRIERALLDSE